MAEVYTVTVTLIGILVSLPALLVAINLLYPRLTQRIQQRLEETPRRSFVMGLPITAVFLSLGLPLAGAGGPAQAAGILLLILFMGVGSLGGAGFSRLLAQRLNTISQPHSQLISLLRGALLYELACLTPLVGWFLFIPLAGITLIGATSFALLGWLPRRPPAEDLTISVQP